MKPTKQVKLKSYASCIFMMLALLWLTVSLPVVNAAQQKAQTSSLQQQLPTENTEDDTSNNPFGNTTEEKTSNNTTTLSEEYLHDNHSSEDYITVPSTEYKVEHASIYIAFHGELISPPPDAC